MEIEKVDDVGGPPQASAIIMGHFECNLMPSTWRTTTAHCLQWYDDVPLRGNSIPSTSRNDRNDNETVNFSFNFSQQQQHKKEEIQHFSLACHSRNVTTRYPFMTTDRPTTKCSHTHTYNRTIAAFFSPQTGHSWAGVSPKIPRNLQWTIGNQLQLPTKSI